MNNEELMKPRRKVIAPFPGMNFIGESGFTLGKIFHPEFKYQQYFFNGVNIDDYPHLFKPLEWWEERTLEDMPKYLKIEKNGSIGMVNDYDFYNRNSVILLYNGGGVYINLHHLTPATESEYIAQNTPITGTMDALM